MFPKILRFVRAKSQYPQKHNQIIRLVLEIPKYFLCDST